LLVRDGLHHRPAGDRGHGVNPSSHIGAFPAADPAQAAAHFADRLRFETDCSDVHADLVAGFGGFVVLDVRAPEAYAAGHVPGARSLPRAAIAAATTAHLPRDAILVTYCWGAHCNGATKAAAKLAALGFRVKEMLGGIAGWQAEGYTCVVAPAAPPVAESPVLSQHT
jgi:rhodanese-related sulfurtransferase